MKLDFHVLTVMPPHNVNRDEDGRPKTAFFGNTQRGRISSQAKKRAIRFSSHFKDCQRATRTREAGLMAYIALCAPEEEGLEGVQKVDEAIGVMAALAVNHALGGGGKSAPDAAAAKAHIKKLEEKKETDAITRARNDLGLDEKAAREHVLRRTLRSGPGLVVSKKEFENIDNFIDKVRKACSAEGDSVKAVEALCAEICKERLLAPSDHDDDTALFGRMVATYPTYNVDAACAVSHAITTHSFAPEGDYFSAGEELNKLNERGAAITSYAFFGSGVYYQHVVLDVDHLIKNLNERSKDADKVVRSFIEGLCQAQPTGKRNSHGSDVVASYVICSRGDTPSFNAALAFLKPVQASADQDLLAASAEQLRAFFEATLKSYNIAPEYIVFSSVPSLRTGNEPGEKEAWEIKDLYSFAEGAIKQPATAS